jgi:hypothetical protein
MSTVLSPSGITGGECYPTTYRHPYWQEYNYTEPFSGSSGSQTQTWYWNCSSYAAFEVTIFNHQTNGGSSANKFIRGIWASNHSNNQWEILEDFGGLPNASYTFAVTDATGSGNTDPSGRLTVTMAYAGNFGSVNNTRIILRKLVGSITGYTHTSV